MGLRARVALASGAAAAAGAGLLLSGRVAGSALTALLLAGVARAAPAASVLEAGPVAGALAHRTLLRQAALAPAWALVLAAGAYRAGSADLGDIRGAHAVAGLALARGDALGVAGAWLGLLAIGAAALAAGLPGMRSEAGPGRAGALAVPEAVRRLDALALALQSVLAAALFAGPHVAGASDVLPWAAVAGGLALAAWRAGAFLGTRREVPLAAGAAGALSLALVLAGGRA